MTQKKESAGPAPDGPTGRPSLRAPDALLTTAEAAVLLGLSPRTLEAFRVRGGGPIYFQVTRRAVRYRREDLDAWLFARRRRSTADPGPTEAASNASGR